MWVIAIHKRLRVNAEQNCIFSNKIHLPKFGISVVHDCEKYVTLFFLSFRLQHYFNSHCCYIFFCIYSFTRTIHVLIHHETQATFMVFK